jgi:putative ABC transport system permease protein
MVLGIPGALAVMRVLSAYVFELSPADPASLGGAVALMLLTAGLAAAGPAWRAARVDPVRTLRAE